MEKKEKKIGVIKWFGGYNGRTGEDNKYGFLSNDIYIHKNSLLCDPKGLVESILVTYNVSKNKKNGKDEGLNVNLLANETDFDFLVSTLTDKEFKSTIMNRIIDIIKSYDNEEIKNEYIDILLTELKFFEAQNIFEQTKFFTEIGNNILLNFSYIEKYIKNLTSEEINPEFMALASNFPEITIRLFKNSSTKNILFSKIIEYRKNKLEMIRIFSSLFTPAELFELITQENVFKYIYEDSILSLSGLYPKLIGVITAEEESIRALDFKSYFNFIPKTNFYSNILFIKKSIYLYKRNNDINLLTYCLRNLNIKDNFLLNTLSELVAIFCENSIGHDKIISIIGKNFWHFLDSKQELFRKGEIDIIRGYFSLLLPVCCQDNKKNRLSHGETFAHFSFREARFRKSKEEVKINLKQWQEANKLDKDFTGNIETCTGEFNCRSFKCYHAETYSSISIEKDYKDYTLLDLFSILNFDSFLKPVMNDKTYYIAILCGWINHITEKDRYYHFLCSECNRLLSPGKENQEAYFFDWVRIAVYFKCIKHQENGHDKEVYISHCKNFHCDEIIDSRTSQKKCSNDKYICPKCNFCNCEGRHISDSIKVQIPDNVPCLYCFRKLTPIKNSRNNEYNFHCTYCVKNFDQSIIQSLRAKEIPVGWGVKFNTRNVTEEHSNPKFLVNFKPTNGNL